MQVTGKCDVYSFSVLALEIIKGEHPRNIIATMPPLNDMLDERLSPSPEVQEKLAIIVNLAFSCLHVNPHNRPDMQMVCRFLSN